MVILVKLESNIANQMTHLIVRRLCQGPTFANKLCYLLGRVTETSHLVKLQQVHWATLSHPAKLERPIICHWITKRTYTVTIQNRHELAVSITSVMHMLQSLTDGHQTAIQLLFYLF